MINEKLYITIILEILPATYSSCVSGFLGSADPKTVTWLDVQERVLAEEGRRATSLATPSALLNVSAPIKGDKKKIKCYYCQKPGHKSNECRKKKRDEGEKGEKGGKEKDKDKASAPASSAKSANVHILVPTT